MPKIIQAATQEHLPIADIKEDLLLLKDGGGALVLESTSLNFSLLSEKEQDAIIAAYSAFLNSLSFPIQILIRTQKEDISEYLAYLAEEQKKQTNPLISQMLARYAEFVAQTVRRKNVLSKRFFIIIPFSYLELGVGRALLGIFKKPKKLTFPKSYILKKAKVSLHPKRDHLIRQSARVGLRLRQLTSSELLELFFEIYNPGKTFPPDWQEGLRQIIFQKEEEVKNEQPQKR